MGAGEDAKGEEDMASVLMRLISSMALICGCSGGSGRGGRGSSANTPKQMFEAIVESPVPDDVTELDGGGDTWQGYRIYLVFRASDAFIQKMVSKDYELVSCSTLQRRLELSDDLDVLRDRWKAPTVKNAKCYEGESKNKWGNGLHSIVVDVAAGTVYLMGIAA